MPDRGGPFQFSVPAPIKRDGDPEFMDLGQQCLELDGCYFCPAEAVMAVSERRPGKTVITVLLARNRIGLAWRFTAPGAREMAEQLLAMANELEAEQLDAAKAQLAETLQKRNPQ